MDVFALRHRVIDDYARYVRSFSTIRDPRIDAHVVAELEAGRLWPEPLLQVSPAFAPGESLDELIAAGEMHPACRDIFAQGHLQAARAGSKRRDRSTARAIDDSACGRIAVARVLAAA